MEPVCKLPGGRMREAHVFDEDGLCECGERKPAPHAPLVRTLGAAAALTRRSVAVRPRKPNPDQRAAFGQMGGRGSAPGAPPASAPSDAVPPKGSGSAVSAAPIRAVITVSKDVRPEPVGELVIGAGVPASAPAEDVTQPVNWDAAIAELELERDEINVALDTLRRIRSRRVALAAARRSSHPGGDAA
jgi:hypothetical protein